ncbi:MAG: ABC transporter permease [Ignavibacteria bacterium]|nr:ABC transporter permease [Ignavibacteria bacterium]
MKTIFKLVSKEILIFRKDKVVVALTFLVPIVLIFIFGKVFGVDSGKSKIKIGFVNESKSEIAKKLETTLDTSSTFTLIKTYKNEKNEEIKYDTNSLKSAIKSGKFSSALVIPVDAYTDTSTALKLKFYYDPKSDIEMAITEGVLYQTILSQLPEVFVKSMQRQAIGTLGQERGTMFNNEIAKTISKYYNIDTSKILNSEINYNETTSDSNKTNIFEKILNIEKTQLVGKDVANPMATRSVGGWAIMFLMFTITAAATSLFDEKKTGIMIRLLSTPATRTDILWSKYITFVLIGISQLIALFIAGSLMFNIQIFDYFLKLLVVITVSSMVCTSFGMFLSSICRTSGQATGLGTFLILTMSAIGGAWFPVSLMPEYIRFFSKLTTVYWSMEAFLDVLWRRLDFIDILPNILILLAITAVIITISLFNFRKSNLF